MEARFYRSLYRIRRVEEEIARIYPSDKIKSPVHLSIGQEAVSVGICEALGPGDVVFGSYRCHAMYLAKGGDLQRMMAELYGKSTGTSKGKGGSMHLIDAENGVMGASAVVGTTIPNAVGYAYALKLKRQESIVVCFFGDGAVDEGVFYESLNFAALKELPMIFVCENNGYAIHTHQRDRQANPDVCQRARALGLPAETIRDDVFEVHRLVNEAVQALRGGGTGPLFFECLTYRWKEHVGPSEDFYMGYRSEADAACWIENDQVKRVGEMLPAGQRAAIEAKVNLEVDQAFAFAEESPFPLEQELYADVFKDASL